MESYEMGSNGMPLLLLLLLLLVVAHQRSPQASEAASDDGEWWRREIVYQIYPRSFRDSDGDGTGDIRGIIEKLDYISDLGANAVWLSPVYRSPMADFGYDISNHTDIDPIFGSMADFDELLRQLHGRGMRLVMDFVPNHTSDQHPWFQASRRQRHGGRYSNHYVWVDCTQPSVAGGRPGGVNNWLSAFGGTAWTYDSVRGQCYLHQFASQQPDLNFNEAAVRDDVAEVVRFWAAKGVDGLRVDAVRHLFEDPLLRDEPPATGEMWRTDDASDHAHLHHVYTADYNETYPLLRQWRRILEDGDGASPRRRRLLVAEAYSPLPTLARYYSFGGEEVADFPFNFELLLASAPRRPFCNARCLQAAAAGFHGNVPAGRCANWVLGNHDNNRVASRFPPAGKFSRALNTLLLTLPGTPVCYYGDELGMEDVPLLPDQMVDPLGRRFPEQSRDPARAPMLWHEGPSAGFTEGQRPWLPVEPEFRRKCARAQQGSPNSTLAGFKAVAALRRRREFVEGDLRFLMVDERLLVYRRAAGGVAYIVALYISQDTQPLLLDLGLRCRSVAVALELRARPGAGVGDAVGTVAMEPGDAVIVRAQHCDDDDPQPTAKPLPPQRMEL